MLNDISKYRSYCKNVASSLLNAFDKNFTLTKYNKLMKRIRKFKMKLIVLVDFLKIRWYINIHAISKNFNKFITDINMIFILTKKN